MIQPDDGEMAAIERRHLALTEAFHDRKDRCVDEAEPQVRVRAEQFADPDVIAGLQRLDDEGPALHVVEKAGERGDGNEVIEFHEHGGGDEPDPDPRPQELSARAVVLVVSVQQRDERARVDYERNGGGSYSVPALARRARSPVPERKVPAQRISGTAAVGPSSRSSASRTTCATDTPRSAARRRALSSSASSAWIIILFMTPS